MEDKKPDRGRFSAKRKAEAVVRLLKGESLDAVSREVGVTAARLSAWREAFISGAERQLRSRGDEGGDEKDRLRAKIGELTMENELLRDRARRAEAQFPFASRRSKP
jgi:hypothetical protein